MPDRSTSGGVAAPGRRSADLTFGDRVAGLRRLRVEARVAGALLCAAAGAILLASAATQPPGASSRIAASRTAAASCQPPAAAASQAPPDAPAGDGGSRRSFVVRGARVFDGVRALGVADVLVTGSRIVAVGKGVAVPPGTTVIAGAGRTLLPGLIDAHAHAWGDHLRDALIFGVTTELDMFANAQWAAKVKADQAAGRRLDEADLRSAGTLATTPGGHGTEYGFPIPTLTRPDEAQAWVDARIAEGSDYVKIVIEDGRIFGRQFTTLDQPTVAALVAAAHRRGKLAVVHISTLAGAREAIEAGADGLAHLPVDQPPDPGFGRFAAAHHVFAITTLSVDQGIGGGQPAGAALVRDPRLAPYIDPDDAANLERHYPNRPGITARYAAAVAALRQLQAAGVALLAGTDAPNPGTAHGASLHGELELLVAGGLSPAAALAAATSVPAAVFHLADRGRIAPGLRADLLLVDGDPTADVRQTRAIAGVWKAGVAADRDAYRAEVAGLRAVKAAFGRGWSVSTDRIAGGGSTAALAVVEDAPPAAPGTSATGAPSPAGAASGHAIEVTGKVAPGAFIAWAGASLWPGDAPFTAVDLSARKGVHFWARGDGRTYQVMLLAQSHGHMPLFQAFTAGPAWKEYDFPFQSFAGYDGHDVQAVVFAAASAPGAFALRLSSVRLE
jgi:imidazolonepropionase-like amidohydrolase